MKYIKESNIRGYANIRGKQVSKEFLYVLDTIVHHILDVSCEKFNGHKSRLNSSLIPRRYTEKL